MEIITYVCLVFFGAAFGSFAGAQVWRLRLKHLLELKKSSEISKFEEKELSKLQKINNKKISKDRSVCLHCGYKLQWYDMIPVFSWLFLRGKCRSCKKTIGWFEFLMEIGLAAVFVLSFVFWPFGLNDVLEWFYFAAWCSLLIPLAILFAYDAKWSILPDIATLWFSFLTIIWLVLGYFVNQANQQYILGVFGGILVLAGVYCALYYFSRFKNGEDGTWVGFGDVKISFALGAISGSWQAGLIALFLANFIGMVYIMPSMIKKKVSKNSHIPFGPFLIIGGILAFFFGVKLFQWYTGIYSA